MGVADGAARNAHSTLLCMTQEAEAAEQANPPMVATCQAIVKEVIDIGVEEEDRKRTWKADAEVLPRLHCTNEGLRP